MSDKGHLFVVGTPIGNLEDITLRAISTLKDVNIILAEDTRNSKKLLSAHGIQTRMMSYHEYSSEKESQKIVDLLLEGNDLALISDAGTPTISDPGYGLIRECIKHEIRIIPIPGVSAITAAMSASGLPSDSFTFHGFLPQKKGRLKKIQDLSYIDNTIILFESPYRLVKTLTQLLESLGDRSVVVGRELTKLYEEIIRGNLSEVLEYFSKSKVKGEIVIMIGKKDDRIHF
jgi:16S rRNA (cytidine1402-2'-O)-methyltransferase